MVEMLQMSASKSLAIAGGYVKHQTQYLKRSLKRFQVEPYLRPNLPADLYKLRYLVQFRKVAYRFSALILLTVHLQLA